MTSFTDTITACNKANLIKAKNKLTADIIYIGGTVYTLNDDMPWTNSVAVKNGIIIALGDYCNSTKNGSTDFFDLEGNFMLPGFIAMDSSLIDENLYDDVEDEITDTYYETSSYILKNFLGDGYTSVFSGNTYESVIKIYESNLKRMEEVDGKQQRLFSTTDINDNLGQELFTAEHIQELAIQLETSLPPSEEISRRTVGAAKDLGLFDILGSIEDGKLADFVIFDEDPFKFEQKKNARLPEALYVALSGEIIYDSDSESDLEWYNLMANQQF